MELENLGWNILTLSSIATLIFTFFQTSRFFSQNKLIWSNKSGQSVSILKFSSTPAFFLLNGVYGYFIGSIIMPITSVLLTAMHVPILVGLYKFKGFSRIEKLLIPIFFLMTPVLVLIPAKTGFFMALAFLRMIPFAMQPLEIYKEKNVSVLDIKLFLAYLVGAFFWVTFYFAFGNLPLKIISSMNTLILVSIVFLYFKYRDNI